jgi:Tat protein translocase TatB subunit
VFGTLGGPELFLILVVALIIFGPRKLPEIGRSIGQMLGELRRASNDFKRTIDDEIEADRRQPAPSLPALEPPGPAPVVAPPEAATVSREALPAEPAAPPAEPVAPPPEPQR